MSSYYKHTKTASVDVPYSFRCEQCMKDSGPLKATIFAQAELNSNFKNLNEKKQQKLNEMAHNNLVKAVKEAHQDATEKQVYAKAFIDKCPHCQKPQSWAVSGIKKGMFSTPIIGVILGVILGAGCYFFSGMENNLMIAIIAAAVCIVISVGIFIWDLIKLGSKKRKTAGVVQKNVPVIEWGAVQYILNEK